MYEKEKQLVSEISKRLENRLDLTPDVITDVTNEISKKYGFEVRELLGHGEDGFISTIVEIIGKNVVFIVDLANRDKEGNCDYVYYPLVVEDLKLAIETLKTSNDPLLEMVARMLELEE